MNVLIAAACNICFEPKTGENRPRNVAPLVRDDAVRNGDVKVAGGGQRDGGDPL